ncbi:hypothetical protein HRbin23_00782 [bacterium HR23]|nr:hypothetical protein HRbin23_00782 [bacterium HR23]
MDRRKALGRLARLLMGGVGMLVPGKPSPREQVLRTPLPGGDSIFAPAEGAIREKRGVGEEGKSGG